MNLDWVPTLLLTIFGGGSVAALIVALSQRRKVGAETTKARADAADIVSDSAIALLAPLREEMGTLRAEVKELRSEIAAVKEQLRVEERRSWAAVAYIRKLIDSHRLHAPDVPLPDVPDTLRDIL